MKMIKKIIKSNLLKSTGIYTLTSIINALIPFLLLPILTRYLSPEDYGIVSMFILLVALVSPLVGLSVNSAITRRYYDNEETKIGKYVFNSLFIVIVSTMIIGIVLFIFKEPIAQVTAFPVEYLWTVLLYSFFQIFTVILLVLWQVNKKPIFYGIFNILLTLLNVSVSILLVVVFNKGWEGRVTGQLLAISVFAILALFILFKNNWIKFDVSKNDIKSILSYSLPLIPHGLSGSIISITDRLFITNMVGIAATGVYSVGYQVGSIINLLANSFNNAFVPWLFEKLKENNELTNRKIVKFTYIYFIGIFLLALLFGLIAPYFLSIFLGKAFNEASDFVLWIALGYAFNGMYFMVVNYIFYSKKTKILATVTFGTAVFNVISTFIFVKWFGAIGAAQATAIVFAIKFFVVWYIAAKVYKMPWKIPFRK